MLFNRWSCLTFFQSFNLLSQMTMIQACSLIQNLEVTFYFLELLFQKKVYPLKLDIYETYNPGCIVRILACEKSDGTDVDTGKTLYV